MATVRVYGQFTKLGSGVTPSAAPTVDVYEIIRATNAVTQIVTGDAVTALVANGTYFYAVVGADLTANEYLAFFKTSDTTVDLQQVPALQQIVANVDVLTTYTDNTPQTGDGFARLGAPAGASVSADIATVAAIATAVNNKTLNLPPDPADGSVIAGRFDAVDAAITALGSPAQPGDAMTLSPNAFDSITIETGMNARQALAVVTAAAGGKLSGATQSGGTITVNGAGVTTTRITADTDANGNRVSVTLNPPA